MTFGWSTSSCDSTYSFRTSNKLSAVIVFSKKQKWTNNIVAPNTTPPTDLQAVIFNFNSNDFSIPKFLLVKFSRRNLKVNAIKKIIFAGL